MSSIIGFTAIAGGKAENLAAALAAQQQALSYFKELNQLSIRIGETYLEVWGHDQLSDCIHYLPDGSLLLLVGSPLGCFPWPTIQNSLAKVSHPKDFELPWEGRVILLKINSDGQQWTMWNDWLGSIPVFHTPIGQGRIASTLEPVVVAAAKFTPDDIFLPALLSLLIHGHYLSDWTLFKPMKVAPPDCAAVWAAGNFQFERNFTVVPSTERWERGWDELVDEMHELLHRAISEVLKTQPAWILPLSGGLDSRLIAAIGAETGVELYTYTFGDVTSRDVIFARQAAETLGLPWKQVDLGTDYLINYTRQWADLFGSAMHFHGMHQMVFLDRLKTEPPGPIVSGFLGDALSGYGTRFVTEFHASGEKTQIVPDSYAHWSKPEIEALMKIPVKEAFEELTCEIQRSINAVPGARFQQLSYLMLWSRQRFFTYFNSMLGDYWRGVATPFINRAYARFCDSLPRAILDDRRLQADMIERYYPKLAVMPTTYWRPGHRVGAPITPSGSYLFKRRLAEKLPVPLRRGPLQEFGQAKMTTEADCVRATGPDALWPIYDVWDRLAEWVDVGRVAEIYQTVIDNNSTDSTKSIPKLHMVQTLAYRLLNDDKVSNGDS